MSENKWRNKKFAVSRGNDNKLLSRSDNGKVGSNWGERLYCEQNHAPSIDSIKQFGEHAFLMLLRNAIKEVAVGMKWKQWLQSLQCGLQLKWTKGEKKTVVVVFISGNAFPQDFVELLVCSKTTTTRGEGEGGGFQIKSDMFTRIFTFVRVGNWESGLMNPSSVWIRWYSRRAKQPFVVHCNKLN